MLSILSSAGWDNFVAGFNDFTSAMTKFFTSGLGKIVLFIIVAIIGFILIKLFI